MCSSTIKLIVHFKIKLLVKIIIRTVSTIPHKDNETNDTFYQKVAFLMYMEMVNFRPQSWKAAPKQKRQRGLGTRLLSSW